MNVRLGRLALSIAGSLVIAAGVVLVLLPQGGSGGGEGQNGEQPIGVPSNVVAGVLVAIVGLALLVLGILNRAWAGPGHSVPEPWVPATSTSETVPLRNPPPSESEATLVRWLDEDERLMYTRLREGGGQALQRDIVAWRTFSPAKVSRLLDRLEAKGLLIRERHGSTNRVRLTKPPRIPPK